MPFLEFQFMCSYSRNIPIIDRHANDIVGNRATIARQPVYARCPLNIPLENLLVELGVESGLRMGISDGYRVMLPPLAAGEHVVTLSATNKALGEPTERTSSDDCGGGACVDAYCQVPCEDDFDCMAAGVSCGIFGQCVVAWHVGASYEITVD